MTQEENATPPPEEKAEKKKRNWPRRVLIGFLLLLLVAVFFHRPIMRGAIRYAVIRVAATQNLKLDFKIRGNLFTHLAIDDLHAVADGPSPVERINIRTFDVRYSFWDLLRLGPSNLISSYRLDDADIVVTLNKATEAQKIKFAKTLRQILEQPALYSDTVEVNNLNLVAHQPEGDLVIADLNLSLHPNEEGILKARQVTIPKVASWEGISATTSYADRHLAVSNLQLGDQIHVSQVVLDSSHRAEGINYLSFRGTLFGGDVALFLWQKRTDTEDYAKLTASVERLSLREVRDFLKLEPVMEGEVTNAWIDIDGSPDLPHTWRGEGALALKDLSVSSVEIGNVSTDLSVSDGVARIQNGTVTTGKNRIAFQSEYRLPQSTEDLFTSGIEADLAISVTEPGRFYPGLKEADFQGTGRLTVDQRQLTLTLQNKLSGLTGEINGKVIAVGKGASQLTASYRIAQRQPDTPWFRGLKIDHDATFENIRYDQWQVDHTTLNASLDEANITVTKAELRRGQNTASFQGNLALSHPFSWNATAFNVRFEVALPSLTEFNAVPESPDAIHGVVSAQGAFVKESGNDPQGEARLEATDLSWRGFKANRLATTLPVRDQQVQIVGLELDINGVDKVTGSGIIGLRDPFPYEGQIDASISDLSVFSDLLNRPLSGALQINWRGSGELRNLLHEGRGFLSIQNGSFPPLTGVQVEIGGAYSPETIDIPKFRVVSDQGSLETVIALRDQQLSLRQIALRIADAGAVTGYLNLPFDLRTLERPETILPKTGQVDGKLQLERVSIPALLEALQSLKPAQSEGTLAEEKEIAMPERRLTARPVALRDEPAGPPLSGFIEATLVAKGTIDAPEIALALEGTQLRTAAARVEPSHLSARLLYRENRLALDGTLSIPGLNPLLFAGDLPVPLHETMERGGLDPATPVRFSVRLPRSSATVLTRFTPAIRYIEGSLAIDASLGGTLENPTFRGGITAELPAIRFAAANFPGVSNFQMDLQFANDVLSFRRFSGSLAGGPFRLTGGILLKSLANPEIDLHLQSDGTLLVRNDSVTVRADSDIRVRGPFKSAAVTGAVGIKRSRFFRDIQIIPIGLPGNAAPKPAQGPSAPPSITIAPFRDWTFDLQIKTTEPFVVRSNLANGKIYGDLRLGGTGLAPTLEGIASIRGFVASLPFSTLNVDYGYVYFTANDPFNPTLDISGTSRLRNYNIHAYIYGTADNPETVFTSEPPLPQEEIVALLATGATTSEFTDNSELLAGRAAFLLLQDLYRKVFKRKSAPPTVTAQNDFANRFKLDVGSVDPRTGRQQLGGTFRVTDQVEVGAGIDLEGDARAEVRYLIRFR